MRARSETGHSPRAKESRSMTDERNIGEGMGGWREDNVFYDQDVGI